MQRNTLFLACFFIGVNSLAQQYPFVYYTPKDGLVNSRVRSIKQDSRGRMIFMTYGGLSIYDGTRFVNYNQQDGLANDLVNDVVEISPDSFLVSTNTRQLNTLVHGKIGVYQTADNFYPTINRFFKTKNGNWFAVADEGLFEFKNRKFTSLPFQKNGKDLGICLDKIVEWNHWFLILPWNSNLSQKLILYNTATHQVDDALVNLETFDIAMDSKNRVWVNTRDGVRQLDPTDLLKGKIVFKPAPGPYHSIKNTSLFFDASGNAWFYSNNEVQKISPRLQTQVFSTEQGLKAGNLTFLFQDREGTLWMATDGNGVIKLKSGNVKLYTSIGSGKQLAARAICQQLDTTWLFNEPDNSVYRLEGTEKEKFPLPHKIKVERMYSFGGALYLANSKKILLVNKKNEALFYSHPRIFFADPAIAIGSLVMDRYGSLVGVLQKNNENYLALVRQNRVFLLYHLHTLVDQIAFDRQGYLWVAQRDDRIMVFQLNPREESHYLQLVENFSNSLPAMGARSITTDRKGGVWIGTRYHGLYHFLPTHHTLQLKDHFTTKNGLTDNFVYTLACDSNNTIWAGTQTGLDKIFTNGTRWIIANTGKNNNNFQIVTRIEIAKDGTVWSLNNDGTVLKISPEVPPANPPIPSLLFTSISVNNLPSGEGVRNFSYQENNFYFTVAAPSFIDEKSIRYSYLLKGGSNNHWSDASNLSAFSFVGLSPGSYTLLVHCTFPEAMYPEQETSYSFVIRKPWWQTWWFLTMAALMSALVFFLLIRDYYQRKLQKQKILLEKKQAVEKERTRIATDMHDDLGAGLSRIKFLSETIGIKKQQQQPIEEEVIKIREYSNEMIGKMGEIVWTLNEKNDSLSDLIVYTRAYAMEYLFENGISCKVELPSMPDNIFVSGEFRRNIFLSVKEALHNIVKHAQASQVALTIQVNRGLLIEIQDDGIGFRPSQIGRFSNGIFNIEKRMKEIHGTSEIKCRPGTTVTLKAPLS